MLLLCAALVAVQYGFDFEVTMRVTACQILGQVCENFHNHQRRLLFEYSGCPSDISSFALDACESVFNSTASKTETQGLDPRYLLQCENLGPAVELVDSVVCLHC